MAAVDPNSFRSKDPVVGFDFSMVYDDLADAPAKLGTRITTEGGTFQFAQLDEAAGLAVGYFAILQSTGQAQAMNTTDSAASPKQIGVACATLTDNQYGWFWRGPGSWEAIVVNAVSADSSLTTTATDGVAGTGGDVIQGLKNVDAGVTSTLVTVNASVEMTTNV